MDKPVSARSVIAIDGEGRDRGPEDHIYGLLLAYSSKPDLTGSIADWHRGLSTRRCLDFLLSLKHGRNTIVCSFFFNYDVTMWLRDLMVPELLALWWSGWVVYACDERLYYIRYIPNKMFFVGLCDKELAWYIARDGAAPAVYSWPRDLRCTLVYDVASFSQKSFVKTLADWHIECPQEIVEMKAARGTFTADMAERVEHYCELEMIALAQYVQTLDVVFQAEGITLSGWYGPGSIASALLKRHGMKQYLADPTDPGARHAVMSAYFGGRNELFRMGHMANVHNYDLNSAYPSAARRIPDLAHGRWQYRGKADIGKWNTWEHMQDFAVWRVRWDIRNSPIARIGPFPFRDKRQVLYPSAGEGWYHNEEVLAAMYQYGPTEICVLEGWQYQPDSVSYPFHWINEAATRRVALKHAGDPRASVYKYGLNSLYGKLAQHASEAGTIPPFQCYYAAGLITAITRANLLMFMLEPPFQDDLVMVATDGVFCLGERMRNVGNDLGQFEDSGTLDDCYIIQPGVYYTQSGKRRTRGFGVTALDYNRVASEWQRKGTDGHVDFTETRFVGLGTCAGTGDFRSYGQWVTHDGRDMLHARRSLSFSPFKKFPAASDARGGRTAAPDSVRLVPMDYSGMVSAAYEPRRINDPSWAQELLDEYLEELITYDQPHLTNS